MLAGWRAGNNFLTSSFGVGIYSMNIRIHFGPSHKTQGLTSRFASFVQRDNEQQNGFEPSFVATFEEASPERVDQGLHCNADGTEA